MNCPFCDPKVIEKQSLYETENIRIIYNICPANKGQCLVVPKRHVLNIRELTKDELVDLIFSIQLVSLRYDQYFKPAGFNYGFNEGRYAGQMVDHFHFHIMPRVDGDKNRLPEHHLFHRDPKTRRNLTFEEIEPFVTELKKLFR
ncbi:MAG TPA: HIT family protein [Candidatus Bathyarchaeia archaeon]|nr:HIT family protein [Candidatus Bathyarchaeia archaeon]